MVGSDPILKFYYLGGCVGAVVDESVGCISHEAAAGFIRNAGTVGAYPAEFAITLGSATGSIMFRFNSFTVPDKYVMLWNGNEVINTGYRGNTAYQATLNTTLATRGLPPETIVAPGNGTTSFLKTGSAATAIVRVYSPLKSTSWNWTASCPGQTV